MSPSANESSLAHSCAAGMHLAQQILEDRLDAAIDAGLMDFEICDACNADAASIVTASRQRLRQAWAARDRHLLRTARLAQRAQARAARRSTTEVGSGPALPAAAQAALDRARARVLRGNGK